MPPRRRTTDPPPLSDDDVSRLRDELRRGGSPRVTVRSTGGQPAGSRGPVIEVRDPAEAGPEHIVVRIGSDDLPFAPGELSMGGRGRPAEPEAPAPARRRAARAQTGSGQTGSDQTRLPVPAGRPAR
ncbi:MAG: hypothetical protein ACJ74O_16285, partial [Frankiaceae bacterium]